MYIYFSVSSSVTDAQAIMITAENAMNTTYSITITCIIHPDSDADMCEVTTANGQILRGEHIIRMHLTDTLLVGTFLYIHAYVRMYHTYMPLQYT